MSQSDKQVKSSKQWKSWSHERRGFKHELVLTLCEAGFSVRKAKAIIDAVFATIKSALRRKEEVTVEGFGTWKVVPKGGRGWRFGTIVIFRPFKAEFEEDAAAIFRAMDPNWKGHAAWEKRRKKRPKLSKRQAVERERLKAEQRQAELHEQCVQTIMEFVRFHAQDWEQFWVLRWYSPTFLAAAAEIPRPDEYRPIERASEVIAATRPREVSEIRVNRLLDCVEWYARWTRRISVDAALWRDYEREAADRLLGRR